MTINFISGEGGAVTNDISLEELSNQLRMIQSGERRIAIIGTRNLPITHQQVVETLAYSLALSRNTIITSGGSTGVNIAAIQGTIKANPELLEVVLPQTLEQQSAETEIILKNVKMIVEHPERKDLEFSEACTICYKEIISSAHQLICFLYHDSNTLAEAIKFAQMSRKILTIFYLD